MTLGPDHQPPTTVPSDRRQGDLKTALDRARSEAAAAHALASQRLVSLRLSQQRQAKAASAAASESLALKQAVAQLRYELDLLGSSRGARLSQALARHKGSPLKAVAAGARVMLSRSPRPPQPPGPPASPTPPKLSPICVLTALRPPVSQEELAHAGARRRAGAQTLALTLDAGRPLTVAAITDDFTRLGLDPECQLINLQPETWRAQLTTTRPDLLFVESAWRGVNGTWHNTVPKLPIELTEILDWCRQQQVPTAFWNKEDPVHFQTFLRTAAEFDWVFTTDLDCVPGYARELGHSRVRCLPFASQPAIHNPIRTGPRRAALVFAGGYYQRYQARMRDLEAAIDGAQAVLPVEIFDRNLGTTVDFYRFPERFEPYIVGTLAPDEIDVAYKGYRYALNMNSVKDSPTMFARRACELLMSGTLTISNCAQGLKNVLGDLVAQSDTASGITTILERLEAEPQLQSRLRAAGLRRVMTEHTYAGRLRLVAATLAGQPLIPTLRAVNLVVLVETEADLDRAFEMVTNQVGIRATITVVSDNLSIQQAAIGRDIKVLSRAEVQSWNQLRPNASAPLAVIDPKAWYGPYYLISLLHGLDFSGQLVVAKALEGELEFTPSSAPVRWSRALVAAGWADGPLDPRLLTDSMPPAETLRIDQWDYRLDGQGIEPPDRTWSAELGLDQGKSMADIDQAAAEAATWAAAQDPVEVVNPATFPTTAAKSVASPYLAVSRNVSGGFSVASDLPTGQSAVESAAPAVISQVWPASVGQPAVRFEAFGATNVGLVLGWLDDSGKDIRQDDFGPDQTHLVTPPAKAESVRIGLRITGPGAATFGRVFVGSHEALAGLSRPVILN